MSRKSMTTNEQDDDLDIPELTLAQLEKNGKGVRGKFSQRYRQESNVVVIEPVLMKKFRSAEAINAALLKFLTFSDEMRGLTRPVAK